MFLEYQRRKVYNPPAIALRKAILACLADAARKRRLPVKGAPLHTPPQPR